MDEFPKKHFTVFIVVASDYDSWENLALFTDEATAQGYRDELELKHRQYDLYPKHPKFSVIPHMVDVSPQELPGAFDVEIDIITGALKSVNWAYYSRPHDLLQVQTGDDDIPVSYRATGCTIDEATARARTLMLSK